MCKLKPRSTKKLLYYEARKLKAICLFPLWSVYIWFVSTLVGYIWFRSSLVDLHLVLFLFGWFTFDTFPLWLVYICFVSSLVGLYLLRFLFGWFTFASFPFWLFYICFVYSLVGLHLLCFLFGRFTFASFPVWSDYAFIKRWRRVTFLA